MKLERTKMKCKKMKLKRREYYMDWERVPNYVREQ